MLCQPPGAHPHHVKGFNTPTWQDISKARELGKKRCTPIIILAKTDATSLQSESVSTLSISEASRAALDSASLASFHECVTQFLRTDDAFASQSLPQTRATARSLVSKALSFGFEFETDVMVFIWAAMILGEDFSEKSLLATNVLNSEELTVFIKVRWLEQWVLAMFDDSDIVRDAH